MFPPIGEEVSDQFFGVIDWESERESSAFLLRQQQPREEKKKRATE